MTRNVTPTGAGASTDSTPSADEMEGRYRIYTLCLCDDCGGTGKDPELLTRSGVHGRESQARCKPCRGEGRRLGLVATASDPESVGVALVTLAAEGEFESCPVGLMDRPEGETGKWLIKPWLPSPRNVSDAGRVLASARHRDII